MIKMPLPDMEYLPKKVKYDSKNDACKVEFEIRRGESVKIYTFQSNTKCPPPLRNALVSFGELLNGVLYDEPVEGYFSLEQISFNFSESKYDDAELSTSVLSNVSVSFTGVLGRRHVWTWTKSEHDKANEMRRRECDYQDVYPYEDAEGTYECELRYSGLVISHYGPDYEGLAAGVTEVIAEAYRYSMLGLTGEPSLFDPVETEYA